MKKLILFFILLAFVLPSANALVIGSQWVNDGTSISANKGEIVSFTYSVFPTMNRFTDSYNIMITLTKEDGTFIRELANTNINGGDYSDTQNFAVNNAGNYSVNIFVRYTTGRDERDTSNLNLKVLDSTTGNNAPVITSTAVTTATVNTLYTYDVDASDADGDTLSYSLTNNPIGMNINSNSGLISWTPQNIGSYDVNVKVSDNKNGVDEQLFVIVVSSVIPGNNAPVIISNPVLTGTVNTLYTYDVDATDADGDTLTYSLVSSPNWMQINNVNGLISGTPTQTGNYDVNVKVSDNKGGVDEQSFVIIVSSVIPGNNAPVITSNPVLTGTVNTLYTYDVDATDADNDVLSYSLINKPANMNINSNSGLISWTPNNIGNYNVNVKVSDNKGGVDEQSFVIIVSSVIPGNNAPYFTNLPATVTAYKNVLFNYDVNAIDADGDTLTYSLVSSPDNVVMNMNTGLITWTPNEVGNYNIQVRVSDNNGGSAVSTLTVNVNIINPNDLNAQIINPNEGDIYYQNTPVLLEGISNPVATNYEWKIFQGNSLIRTITGNIIGGTISTFYNFAETGIYQILFGVSVDDVKSPYDNVNIEVVQQPDVSIKVISYVNNALTVEGVVIDSNLIEKYLWDFEGREREGKIVSIEFTPDKKSVFVVLTAVDKYGNDFIATKLIDLSQFDDGKETSQVHKIRLNDMTFIKSNDAVHVFVNVRNEGNNDEKVSLRVNIGRFVQYDSFTLSKNDVLQRHFVFKETDDQHVINAEATVGSKKYTIYKVM
ncbi:putative Ig domain-containing protein [Candidatus Woesearchaeota archaeon]|nr:putative Ig domain-containing protein [Candidatus Woesearchaeota archaeon]